MRYCSVLSLSNAFVLGSVTEDDCLSNVWVKAAVSEDDWLMFVLSISCYCISPLLIQKVQIWNVIQDEEGVRLCTFNKILIDQLIS